MAWKLFLVAWVAASLVAPGAWGAQFGNYRYNPVEHDDQGRSDEPDFLATGVLGPLVENCVVELPVAGAFAGRCTRPQPAPHGRTGQVAPGCHGDDPGAPMRRHLSGQCGLWTIGAFAAGVAVVRPGTLKEPFAEQGLEGDRAPGAYTLRKDDTIRLLDARFVGSLDPVQHDSVEVNRKVADLQALAGLAVLRDHQLPGGQFLFWWYGEWTDRNGNGVIESLTPGTAGPTRNEFVWLGSCLSLDVRDPSTIAVGACREDGNPNLAPPGAPCADPGSLQGCAGTTVHAWVWPGNHHSYHGAVMLEPGNLRVTGPTDYPGQQLVNWGLFECLEYESCDGADEAAWGDPLLGTQAGLRPDVAGYDSTGYPGDHARMWFSGDSAPVLFYGDDGLLVTRVLVVGANCAPGTMPGAYDAASCTFTDVDRQETLSPLAEALLVGSHAQPAGGAKGLARGAWVVVRDLQV